MDQLLAMFLSASREFGARVRAIGADQWGAPTQDTEWSVADLVGHLIDEHLWMPPLLHGLDLESAGKVVEGTRRLPVDGGVGANLAEAWQEAMTASADAVTEEGALDRTVSLSRGPSPARGYVTEMTFDAAVHAWDLGRAIGHDAPLPEDLVQFVYGEVAGMGDLSSYGDMFKPAVSVPDDAPLIDRLVAATGRHP